MARYIGVILLAALVLWTGEARGACAWVLWQGSGQHPVSLEPARWEPKNATPTSQGCEALRSLAVDQRERDMKFHLEGIPPDKSHLPLKEVLDPDSLRRFNWLWSVQYKCLPDTIDPRTPKGAQ